MQIIPIRDLKNTSDISDMCHRVAEPVYVTKNGYGDMVIMGMEVYEGMLEKLNMYRELEISETHICDVSTREAAESLKELRNKYGL